MKYDYIISIDPDCEKSGLCVMDIGTKKISLSSVYFPELIDLVTGFEKYSVEKNKSMIVIVEAGWLNKSNWHLNTKDSKPVCAMKGNAVGRNHETGRKIVEMLKHYGILVQEVKPLTKYWKGPGKKITHEEISYFIPEFPNRSNQEARDAALLAWHFAGFKIMIKPKKL